MVPSELEMGSRGEQGNLLNLVWAKGQGTRRKFFLLSFSYSMFNEVRDFFVKKLLCLVFLVWTQRIFVSGRRNLFCSLYYFCRRPAPLTNGAGPRNTRTTLLAHPLLSLSERLVDDAHSLVYILRALV